MIVNIDISQEIFGIDMLRALKFSSKHRRKHVLRPLQLYAPCIMCVQYRGGLSTVGVFSTVGDIMSTVGGYHEYRGGIS